MQAQELKQKISVLKKSISKGSASKAVTKAVKLEIAELERNLENLKLAQPPQTTTDVTAQENAQDDAAVDDTPQADNIEEAVPPVGNAPVKQSKSKKKKNKKMLQLEEDRRLAALEAESMPNPKEIEDEEIEKLALAMNRRVRQVAADGHCLYNSISRQLDLLSDSKDTHLSYKELRGMASDWIRSHPDDYLPFLVNKNGDMMSQDEFEEYCNECANTAVWGGQFELQALSQALTRPIHILQTGSPLLKVGQEFENDHEPLVLSYHKHAYVLGEHYNSLEIL